MVFKTTVYGALVTFAKLEILRGEAYQMNPGCGEDRTTSCWIRFSSCSEHLCLPLRLFGGLRVNPPLACRPRDSWVTPREVTGESVQQVAGYRSDSVRDNAVMQWNIINPWTTVSIVRINFTGPATLTAELVPSFATRISLLSLYL